MNAELKDRIAKIYELVKRGATEGERAAAKKALDKTLAKYNLEGIDLDMISRNEYEFTYTGNLEIILLKRILACLIEDGLVMSTLKRYVGGKKSIVASLQYADYVTVSCSYEYFRRHMKMQWNKICIPELNKCRKAKTKNSRRAELQAIFIQNYIIESGLYKQGEITTIDREKLSRKQVMDRVLLDNVEGGKYNRQVNTGHLLN